jgi:hypothetical protein
MQVVTSGPGGDRGICARARQRDRDARPEQAGAGHRAEHRRADREPDQRGVLEAQHTEDREQAAVDEAQREAGAGLAEHEAERAGEVDLPRREPPHRHRRRLQADVAAHAHHERDEARQRRHLRQRGLVAADELGAEQAAEQGGQQPPGALPHSLGQRAAAGLIGLGHTRHAEHVLLRLLPDDVDHVVDRHHAEDAVLLIHDGDRHQVIPGDEAGDLLLVHVGTDGDRVLRHDLRERRVRRAHDEPPQRRDARQAPLPVHHVDVVDVGEILVHLLQLANGAAAGGGVGHREERARHDAAGRVRRVREQLLHVAAVLLVELGEHTLPLLVRHGADHVDGVIGIHPLEQVGHHLLGHLVRDLAHAVVGEEGEQLRRLIPVFDREVEPPLLRPGHVGHDGGDVLDAVHGEQLPQGGLRFPADQAAEQRLCAGVQRP